MSHEDDAGFARFFTYLNLFVAAMLTLVLGDSLVLTFVGWEGVGLCSYLLIGFWYTDGEGVRGPQGVRHEPRSATSGSSSASSRSSRSSARRATPTSSRPRSRIDPAATIQGGLFAGRTFQFAITFALLGLFVGAAASRPSCRSTSGCPTRWPARRRSPPSSTRRRWSPRASTSSPATRTSSASPRRRWRRSRSSARSTALFAALIAFVQTDIKKVLAYSTVSQLGFMFIGVGVRRLVGGRPAPRHPRLLQGLPVPRRGLGDARDGRRDRHPQDGRPLEEDAAHRAHLRHLDPRHHRLRPALRASGRRTPSSADALFSHNHAWPEVGHARLRPRRRSPRSAPRSTCRACSSSPSWASPATHAAEHAHESSPVMTLPLLVLATPRHVALVLALPGHGPFGHGVRALPRAGRSSPGRSGSSRPGTSTRAITPPGRTSSPGPSPRRHRSSPGPCTSARRGAARPRSRGRFPGVYQFAVDKFRVDELYQVLVIEPVRFSAYILWRIVDVFAIDGLLVNGIARFIGG